jgi:Fur family peroxide stress response transcriptional regulator
MQKEAAPFDIDAFSDQCRNNGLRITPQRTAIYRELIRAGSHPSADMVYQQIRRQFPHIAFETVNRSLLTFARSGMLRIIESRSGVRRFDPVLTKHHHMHCVQCGRIIDFTHEAYDDLKIPEAILKKYEIVDQHVIINIICPVCRTNQGG